MDNKETKKINLVDRFKKFTPMHWVLLVFLLIFAAGFLWMLIIYTVDFATGTPFITSSPEKTGEVGQELYAYEITIYIMFLLLFLIMIGLFVYELLFYPLNKIVHDDINRKELVGDRIIDVHDTYKEKYENRNSDKNE